MKTSIISPIGLSPPVVTEMVDHVIKGENKFVSDVVLLVTNKREVRESAELIVSALDVNYENLHTHWVDLPFSDVSSIDDHIEFMKFSLNAINKERIKHGCDYLYLNIAGGRKDMSASLVILGQWIGVDGIFHVICPEIAIFNQKLERLRYQIREHYEAKDLTSFYREHREEFDKLMFPPPESYEVIRIPYLPFPTKELQKMIYFLRKETPTNIMEVEVDREFLKRLEKAGLIHVAKKKVYPTKLGLGFADIFR